GVPEVQRHQDAGGPAGQAAGARHQGHRDRRLDSPGVVGVALQDVARAFGSTQALRGVSLEPAAGEVLAVVGANGAGKSTLNKILSGALAPDRGSGLVGG